MLAFQITSETYHERVRRATCPPFFIYYFILKKTLKVLPTGNYISKLRSGVNRNNLILDINNLRIFSAGFLKVLFVINKTKITWQLTKNQKIAPAKIATVRATIIIQALQSQEKRSNKLLQKILTGSKSSRPITETDHQKQEFNSCFCCYINND